MSRPNIIYAEVFWMYWSSFCVISSFGSMFLLRNGYSNTEIGMLIAFGNILSVAIQPITANIADRSKKINVVRIAIIITLMIVFFEVFTLISNGRSNVLFVMYILMLAFHASLQPLFNSMNVVFLNRGVVIDYGIGRGMGSLGFSVMSLFLGILVAKTSFRILPIVGELCIFLMLAGLLMLNRMYIHGGKNSQCSKVVEDNKKKETITFVEFAKRHKLFLVMTGGIFLMFYDHQIINFFMLQVFENVGGDSADMGVYFSLMSMLEITALVCFTWINKKIRTVTLLKIAVVGLILRALFMFLAPSPLMVQMSLIVNPFGFPLFLVSIVKYINEIMDHGEAVRGQSMYVIVITISAVVATFTGGVILDTFGAGILLLICLITCIIGAGIFLLLIEKVKAEN